MDGLAPSKRPSRLSTFICLVLTEGNSETWKLLRTGTAVGSPLTTVALTGETRLPFGGVAS